MICNLLGLDDTDEQLPRALLQANLAIFLTFSLLISVRFWLHALS